MSEPAVGSRQSPVESGDLYELRVEGHLHACWAEWFDGLEIVHLDGGETLLTGQVADQAALHGVLARVRDLNLKLLSVVKLPARDSVIH